MQMTSTATRKEIENQYLTERAKRAGLAMIETKATIRAIARDFKVSADTIHRDLTVRLPGIDAEIAQKVRHILNYHSSICHLRGGEAKKIKHLKAKRTARA